MWKHAAQWRRALEAFPGYRAVESVCAHRQGSRRVSRDERGTEWVRQERDPGAGKTLRPCASGANLNTGRARGPDKPALAHKKAAPRRAPLQETRFSAGCSVPVYWYLLVPIVSVYELLRRMSRSILLDQPVSVNGVRDLGAQARVVRYDRLPLWVHAAGAGVVDHAGRRVVADRVVGDLQRRDAVGAHAQAAVALHRAPVDGHVGRALPDVEAVLGVVVQAAVLDQHAGAANRPRPARCRCRTRARCPWCS